MKDGLIKDIEIKLSMQGYTREESDKIIHCVISCLDNYEVPQNLTTNTYNLPKMWGGSKKGATHLPQLENNLYVKTQDDQFRPPVCGGGL